MKAKIAYTKKRQRHSPRVFVSVLSFASLVIILPRVVFGAGHPGEHALVENQKAFLLRWCPETSVKPEDGTRFHQVVGPEWLRQRLRDEQDSDGPLLLEVIANSKRTSTTHIPGSIAIDTAEIERAPMWNLISAEELRDVLESKGVRRNRIAVVYGTDLTAVARIIWALMYAGVEDVRLLNGGLSAWKETGGLVVSKFDEPTRSSFGVDVPLHSEYVVGTSEIHPDDLGNNQVLVSVRSWSEFIGQKSGYSYIKPRGRIPGAVWGQDAMDLWDRGTGRLTCPDEVLSHWKNAGITPDKQVVFYCGTGWRSSLAFFYAYVLGYDNTRNYDGSWLEWSSDPNRPIQTGPPE